MADSDEFESYNYDWANGEDTAQRVIDSLRQTGEVNNDVIQQIHIAGLVEAEREAVRQGETHIVAIAKLRANNPHWH